MACHPKWSFGAPSLLCSTQAFSSKGEYKRDKELESEQHTEELKASSKSAQHYELRLSDGNGEAPDTPDANMKDVLKCTECGQIFPRNQVPLLWEHRSKCTGSSECNKLTAKPTDAVVATKVPAGPTKSNVQSSAMGRRGYTKSATTEDLLRCEQFGKRNPRCKHKSESHSPDDTWRRVQQPASSTSCRRPLNSRMAGREALSSSTIEESVKSESDHSAPHACGCGKTFADNQKRDFMKHTLTCPKGTPIGSPGKGHPSSDGLPRKFK